jgi:hypothetical protein
LLQEPRHLQLLADLEDSNVFSLIAGKKQYSAPTDHGLCIKVLCRRAVRRLDMGMKAMGSSPAQHLAWRLLFLAET